MHLFFKRYGENSETIILMHGLFGMLDNWHNIATKLSSTHTVYSVDLRNHGQSPHSDKMNYGLMADDIWELMQSENLSEAIVLGHSMGGKVAMTFANKYPEKTSKLIVVDIAPKAYLSGHDKYFKALKGLDLNQSSRKLIEEQLSKSISNQGEMLFLLKNLHRKNEGGYALKMNLDAIEANYSNISEAIKFINKIDIETCFIKGENSEYILPSDEDNIRSNFTKVEFISVSRAGHWVHAENPSEFFDALMKFISKT